MDIDKVKTMEIIKIQEKATFVITPEFLDQVKYINSKINTVEWSGLIFYKIEGEPKDLANFKIIGYYIHLMDEGSSAYTEFDSDDSITELYSAMPELSPFGGEEYRHGKQHSHNSMAVFHSGTDIQDLVDQTSKYDSYYLSVISNNALDFDIKMSFIAEIPDQKIVPTKFKGAKWQLPKKEVLVTVDFDIEMPDTHITIPETLKERVEEVTTKPVNYARNLHMGHNVHGNGLGGYYDMEDDDTANWNVNYDTNSYRSSQGKIVIRNFLHDFFEEKIALVEVFNALEEAAPIVIDEIVKEFLIKFEKLSDWQRQNIIFYIEEEALGPEKANATYLYEAIWSHVKTID